MKKLFMCIVLCTLPIVSFSQEKFKFSIAQDKVVESAAFTEAAKNVFFVKKDKINHDSYNENQSIVKKKVPLHEGINLATTISRNSKNFPLDQKKMYVIFTDNNALITVMYSAEVDLWVRDYISMEKIIDKDIIANSPTTVCY